MAIAQIPNEKIIRVENAILSLAAARKSSPERMKGIFSRDFTFPFVPLSDSDPERNLRKKDPEFHEKIKELWFSFRDLVQWEFGKNGSNGHFRNSVGTVFRTWNMRNVPTVYNLVDICVVAYDRSVNSRNVVSFSLFPPSNNNSADLLVQDHTKLIERNSTIAAYHIGSFLEVISSLKGQLEKFVHPGNFESIAARQYPSTKIKQEENSLLIDVTSLVGEHLELVRRKE